MEFLIIWIITIIVSFCMEIVQEMRMYKDIADLDYLINNERLSEFGKKFNPDITKKNLMLFLIPFINFLNVIKNTISYNNYKDRVFDELRIIDALEEMNEKELIEYSKNKTGFKAFKLTIERELDLENAEVLEINDSKIYYENKNGNIFILKVEGPVSNSNLHEQKDLVLSYLSEEKKANLKDIEFLIKMGDIFQEESNSSLDSQSIRKEKIDKLEEMIKQYREEREKLIPTNVENKDKEIQKSNKKRYK